MIHIVDINDGGMYHVRKHETGFFGRLDGKCELQSAFVHYVLVQHVPTLHTLKKNECEKSEDCDPRRRDKDARISPVQFLRDREIGTCGTKQGVIINDDDEKEY